MCIRFMLLSLIFAGTLMGQTMQPMNAGGKAENLHPVHGSHAYLSSYQDAGWGRLRNAVLKIGADPKVLLLDVDDMLGAPLTVPENIHLVHMGAATIDLNGNDLTVQGSFAAGTARVFTGAGTVDFARGSVCSVLPQWWDSLQKALDAAADCGAELFLPPGTYVIESTVEHLFTGLVFNSPALTIRGSGPGNTIIDNQSAGQSAFHFGTVNSAVHTGFFLTIQDLEITSSTGTGSHGIQIEDVWLGRISNCFIHHLAGDGIFMTADQLDVGLPKTWRIERAAIFKNAGYGIRFESLNKISAAYNMVVDQVDVEMNTLGGIYAEAELSKITNSIFAYNGTSLFAHGGIHISGVTGYAMTEDLIEGCGFEANYPYDIYADRFLNLKITGCDLSRIEWMGGAKPDNFIRLDGPYVGINAVIEDNHFISVQPLYPFTAVLGGTELQNVTLDNNRFNILGTDKRYDFDPATKVTYRQSGDTTWTNQTLAFADSVTAQKDTYIQRGSPGIVKVTGGVANALQTVYSSGHSIEIDCAKGLNIAHTLTENTTVAPPMVETAGVVLNIIIFQGPGASYSINFDPAFKLAEPFSARELHFSTIRFLYTGLYWIQLGGAAIDAPF